MSDSSGSRASGPTASLRWWVLALFFASGCAALVYEVTWFQLLELVIGSTAFSLGLLLAVFMSGMCLGALLVARIVPRDLSPLRVYGLLEAGVGLCGLAVIHGLPHLARFYAAHSGPNPWGLVLRGSVSVLCLLPPTLLMGATLPIISRWAGRDTAGFSLVGFLYAANTLGAVFGSLFAGYYLLRVHGMAAASYTAAAINAGVSLLSLLLAAQDGKRVPEPLPEALDMTDHGPSDGAVYAAIAISGACALAAEVLWTRLLALMLGATTYAFSLILAVFLLGLGGGSGLGSVIARRTGRPGWALGICQGILTFCLAWAAFMLCRSLPYWPVNPALSSSLWFTFQLDLLRCAWALLPPAFLWGASFPLALATAAGAGDPAGAVGRVYAANTLGAILGAVVGGVFLMSWLGTQQVERLLIGLTALAGWMMFENPMRKRPGVWMKRAKFGVPVLGLAALLAWSVPRVPWELVAYGRHLPTNTKQEFLLYMGEGMNASVAVTEMPSGVRNFHISGKVEASTDPRDMRLQRMLGHLPALLHPKVTSVLVIGCGAGVTAGVFVLYPDVKRIVICELEPLIPRLVTPFFGEENYDVLQDPRVTIVYDDARHYLLTCRQKFDIITSDPIHPWVKGAASLYTQEYFEMCRRHLNPGGWVSQWVPLYESSRQVVQSELATFFAAFPEGTVWSNDENGAGYDLVLTGPAEATTIELDKLQDRFIRAGYEPVRNSLSAVGFRSSLALMATYAGRATDLRPWLKRAMLNRDAELRLQYLAGLDLDTYQQESIYSELLGYRRFPFDLFKGSTYQRETLVRLLEGPGRTMLGR